MTVAPENTDNSMALQYRSTRDVTDDGSDGM
jgi:hypothetical protein